MAGTPTRRAAWAVDIERALARPGTITSGAVQLTEDYSQANDLAARMPEKVKQCNDFQRRGRQVQRASAGQDTFARALAPRPSATAGKTVFT